MNMKDVRLLAKNRAYPDDMIVMYHVRTIDSTTGKIEHHTNSIDKIGLKDNKLAPHKKVILLRGKDVKWTSAKIPKSIVNPN